MIAPQLIDIPGPVVEPFFTARLPLPPSINASYKVVRTVNGTHLASSEALQQFKDDAALQLVLAEHNWSLINAIRASQKRVPLGIIIKAYFYPVQGKHKARDLDGVLKAVQDVCFHRLELNDELVDEIYMSKHESDDPHVDVEIRCLLTNRG